MPNALVRLPTLEYPTRGVDLSPVSNAITELRKQQEFDAQQGLREEQLALQRQQQDFNQAQATRQAAIQDEDRQKLAIGGVVQSIDSIPADDPRRQQAWGRFVSSQPHYADTLKKYGQDPADHINAPKFILAQMRGPTDPGAEEERQARIAQSRATTNATNTNAAATQMEVTARMHDIARQQGMYLNANGELSYNPGLMSAAFTPGQTKPAGSDTTVIQAGQLPKETREQARQRTIEELGPNVKPAPKPGEVTGEQVPGEGDIQRYWGAVYGQKPPSGYKYGRDGSLVGMKGGADDKTRAAIKGALSSATDNINDVREALRGTNMATRAVSQATGSGTFARSLGPLQIAIRGVLHGISGAQINIPEQKEYFDAMLPRLGDAQSTIEFKLNHLENTLGHIRKFTDGGPSEKDLLDVRNAMRKGLGLKDLSAEDAKLRVDARQRGTGRSSGAGDPAGWSIRKIGP